jgi:hypothetical protein
MQSPIAALTAVCISMPAGVTAVNFESADAAKGCALHTVSSPDVALAAATSDLKLVFAPVKSNPGVGAAAAANLGQKVEILALPKSLAASVAANGTSGLSSTIVDAGRDAATSILAEANQASLAAAATDPSPNNILTRALQGTWNVTTWLGPNSKPGLPTGFDPATYASLATLIAAAVNVGVLPFTVANLVSQGNFTGVAPAVTSALGGLATQTTELPTSFVQTAGWVLTGKPPAAPVKTNAAQSVSRERFL